MKCPKCKRDMVRKKLRDNHYYYECGTCHTVVGDKGGDTQDTTQSSTPEDTHTS